MLTLKPPIEFTLLDKAMDKYKVLEESLLKILAVIAGIIIPLIIAYFRKIPRRYVQAKRRQRNILILDSSNRINSIFQRLKEESGGIYFHIVEYHNCETDEDKKKKLEPLDILNMSVRYELHSEHLCKGCLTGCPLRDKIRPVRGEWQGIPLTDEWRDFNKTTVFLDGKVNNLKIEDAGEYTTGVFKALGIVLYKEVIIYHKRVGWLTLGVSFCERFRNIGTSLDSEIMHSAKQLRNLTLI